MAKLLVFDFDGTIADSKRLYVDSIFRFTKKHGYKLTKEKVERSLGPKLDASLHNAGIKRYAEKIKSEINRYATEKAAGLKLCPYVKEALKKIKRKNIRTALLTNSTRPFINAFLKKNRLKKYFDEILCAEDFLVKEEAFRKLFKKFKIRPQEAVYIADKTKDVKIARKVGCKIVIILACSWDKSKFSHEKFVFRNLKELVSSI